MENKLKYYIIDHQEGALSEWCKAEYSQIIEFLKTSPNKAIITNTDTFIDEFDKCSPNLIKELELDIESNPHKMELIGQQFKSLLAAEGTTDDTYVKVDGKKIPLTRLCLLDMKAESELTHSDADEFDIFLFGGILGDHPSKDRTSYLRVEGYKSRHLGEMQMTTDTALLCTKLVIENKLKLSEIPCVDEPEFFKDDTNKQESVCMEGFRYITDKVDYHTGELLTKENNTAKPLGNK
jgi:ribosome biogenesis SPOUT family RNA methylase Rps3